MFKFIFLINFTVISLSVEWINSFFISIFSKSLNLFVMIFFFKKNCFLYFFNCLWNFDYLFINFYKFKFINLALLNNLALFHPLLLFYYIIIITYTFKKKKFSIFFKKKKNFFFILILF